ncbi:glycerate kinase [Sanguibacter keddieii DSM 10542]|uniref:Glycerate kinase n=1 Tax=Sanguibacter keddieii (strain ATCC 51767 / DSM 10542 / NCFB 3025 / ST-74) TaxID=446469 RepID=D1BFY3_SANKS|nr:glycerate kinase [Sanguibacter keddieii]ACZ21494.1 glycerate kinase [Sanguibacter keddieii DSM 10542]
MRVLLAPTLSGDDAHGLAASSAHLVDAWSGAAPHDTVDLCALSDGGPGFATLVAARSDDLASRADLAPDRRDSWVAPGVLLVGGRGGTAYVDGSVGLRAGAGTVGLGEQLLAALSADPSRVVLGMPGPDQVMVVPDAGWGLLGALGLEGASGRGLADDVAAEVLGGLGAALACLGEVDLVGAAARDLPLLGLHGTSASAGEFGALTAADAQQLERTVGQLAHAVWDSAVSGQAPPPTGHPSLLAPSQAADTATRRLRDVTGLPGAGAGAGVGWLVALAGGRLLPGAAVHAEAVALAPRVAESDLVVTTLDHLDASTFHGSGAEQAATAAAAVGVPCVVVAGTSMMSRRESSAAGLSAVYVASEQPDPRGGRGGEQDGDLPEDGLADVLRRVARSWSPARSAR